MKKARGVATRVAKIYSEFFTHHEPTDLHLIWKIPIFIVLWVVIVPIVIVWEVVNIHSELTFDEPADFNLIWKIPLFIVGWVVYYLLYLFSQKWNRVFIVSCIAISLDPLFLYIPIIDEANQCLGMDKTLRNIILVFRSYIDVVFIYHIFWLIVNEMEGSTSDDANVSESRSKEASCWPLESLRAAIVYKIPWLSMSIVISCLAIVPIPQVAILIVFFRMNGTNLFLIKSMINFALVFQFVIRIFQMYLSSKKVGKVANWVYDSLYFFMYILASQGNDLEYALGMVGTPEKLKAWALGDNNKDSHAAAVVVDLKRKKQEDIRDWLSRNGVRPHLKTEITNSINEDSIVENNINAEVDVEFLFSVLPRKVTKSLRCHLGMNSLMKVPMLKSMHRYELEIICKHLKPVTYKNESYIVREGEVLGFMIFILHGTIILTRSNATTTTSSEITEPSDEKILKEGDFHGEQLLMRWASPNNISFSDHQVISAVSVKCVTKVEALILKAEDLRSAADKCGWQRNLNDCSSESKQLVGHGTDSVVDTSPSVAGMTSTSNEQTVQIHQGHDMLLQQLVLIRETMFPRLDEVVGRLDDQGHRFDDVVGRLDDQGRRLDEMAAFLATLGYNGTSPPPAT